MDNLIDEEILSEDLMIVAEEEIIGEGENAKKQLCFKGVFSEADSVNINKRVYPKSVLRAVFEEAISRSKKTGKPIFGELEHAKDAHVNLERIAVKFPELTWDEETGQIRGKAVPAGPMKNSVITLAEDGFPICFSTRMSGKVKPLTEELRKQLKELGIETLIALTASNEESQRFYKKVPNSEMRDIGIWIDIF